MLILMTKPATIFDPDPDADVEQLGTLGLTLNAIALWNATYIQAALDQLIREGWDISQPDIARISPLAFKHINFLGRYAFDLPQAVAEGALRPLRHPNSE